MKLFEIEQENFKDYMKIVEKECSNILEIYKNPQTNYLYHGTKRNSDFLKKPVKFREKTVSFDKMHHDLSHKMMQDLGYKATRKNSIFTTTDTTVAEIWGDVYIVFPKNRFKYTWFDTVDEYSIFKFEDIFQELEEEYGLDYNMDAEAYEKALFRFQDFLSTELEAYTYDLGPALQENIEVLINDDYVYLLSTYYQDFLDEYLLGKS